MRAAKLTPIATILESEACLISNPHKTNPLIDVIKRRIQGVLAAQKYVLVTYNVKRDDLPAALKVTPGKRAATVSPLENSDWVAVSALVLKVKLAEIMDQLTDAGAEDVLVVALHNCRVD
jgi:ATP phosphoribosyltransferase